MAVAFGATFLRDLNVAVTRAKEKSVFAGSSEWLNKHAKRASGLGQMPGLRAPASRTVTVTSRWAILVRSTTWSVKT